MTLRFLGPVPDPEPVGEALTGVARTAAPAEAVLGPGVDRFGGRVLHVPVSGLGPLAAAVVGATADMGRPPENRPFAGHVTLARVSERRSVDLRPLTGTPITGRWPVDGLCLVRSQLSGAGARYEVLADFPLSGAGPSAAPSGEGPWVAPPGEGPPVAP